MPKHSDTDGDGVADYAQTRRDGDFDLGVDYVPGQYFHRLEQKPGLGRHVLHDARSREYDAATMVEHVTKEQSTYHRRIGPVWDQGDVGACTAFAALGLLMTEPFVGSRTFTPADALDFYRHETQLDDRQIPGHYPPDDTGSTGLWSMKLLKLESLITGYRHAFSLTTVKKLLQLTPVSVGVPWFKSMYNADRQGFLNVFPASGLAGGHQFDLIGVDYERQAVRMENSWGPAWADKGGAYIRFTDMGLLLAQHGDCCVPTGVAG